MDLKENHKWRIKINKLKEHFSINKVITLLKFKSAVNLQCFSLKEQSRERILLRNLIRRALVFVNTKVLFQFLIFILHLWFPLKSTLYLEISRFTFKISGTVYSYIIYYIFYRIYIWYASYIRQKLQLINPELKIIKNWKLRRKTLMYYKSVKSR